MTGPPIRETRRPMGAIRSTHQRFTSRRCVHDDHVEFALVDVIGDPQQVAQLVHPWQDAHLLGEHLVEAVPAEELRDVGLDRPPVAADVEVDVRLLAPQVRRDLRGLRAEWHVEGVGKAVSDVGRQHDRPVAAGGAQEGRRCRDARLADAALAGVEEDPYHVVSGRQVRGSTSYSRPRGTP
jgi:hypothetical protein